MERIFGLQNSQEQMLIPISVQPLEMSDLSRGKEPLYPHTNENEKWIL
jgi:hypothetical protein